MQLAEGLDDEPIVIPSNDRLTALIGVLPLQLIAYELALLKGINPDTPRNLAKVRNNSAGVDEGLFLGGKLSCDFLGIISDESWTVL